MVVNFQSLINCPILSLHTEGEVARVESVIVDPDSLKIMAFRLNGGLAGKGDVGDIVLASSVRETDVRIGMIVNSTDEFVSEGEVVKLDNVIKLNFSLVGLNVVTKKGTKLGKVESFTVSSDDFMVLQIIVKRPIMKALIDPELVISRNEIVSIDDYTITVKDEEEKIRKKAVSEDFIPNFVNPFREGLFEPDRTKTLETKDIE